jgi:hypothetical protein
MHYSGESTNSQHSTHVTDDIYSSWQDINNTRPIPFDKQPHCSPHKMSWHTPPPPMSPRKPKIQQQSWDEVPKINLYDSSRSEDSGVSMSLPGSSSMTSTTKKVVARKCVVGGYQQKYCAPNPKHQMSDPGSYHTSSSLKSPKSPGSQVFEFELTSSPDTNQAKSPLRASIQHFFEDSSVSDSAPAIMTPQRRNSKFEFGAISPKVEQKGGVF